MYSQKHKSAPKSQHPNPSSLFLWFCLWTVWKSCWQMPWTRTSTWRGWSCSRSKTWWSACTSALTSRESTSSSRENLGTICSSWQVGLVPPDHLLLRLWDGNMGSSHTRRLCSEVTLQVSTHINSWMSKLNVWRCILVWEIGTLEWKHGGVEPQSALPYCSNVRCVYVCEPGLDGSHQILKWNFTWNNHSIALFFVEIILFPITKDSSKKLTKIPLRRKGNVAC